MWLSDIEADRLRNLKAVRLALADGLTLVVGRNGQGKSSLLEAIYLLGTGRSFRSRRLDDLISWDGGPLRVAGTVTTRSGQKKLAVVMDGPERRLLSGGAEQLLENFIGRLDVVDLTGERVLVLRGMPEERRRFLDRGLVGLRPVYLLAMGEYRRLLRQRNALLRSMGGRLVPTRTPELEAWDERLVRAAVEIHRSRREYVDLLGASLADVGRVLFPDGREIRIRYRPSPSAAVREESSRYAQILSKTLETERERDCTVGHTGQGPHRDDLRLELDGIDLRRFGSAGQVRASLVALKLGKLSLLREARGEAPLFLMDDFDTDLDEVRAGALAAYLRNGGFQAVVATSKESLAERLGVTLSKVRVEDGQAREA